MNSSTTTNTHGTSMPWVTGLLTMLLIVVQFCSASVFDQLVYNRDAIASGEVWRLVSGHLTHLDWQHLAMNAAAFIGLGYLIETDGANGRRNLLIVLTAAAAAISTALLVFSPATALYAGLSGVLNGLFAYIWLAILCPHTVVVVAGVVGRWRCQGCIRSNLRSGFFRLTGLAT